MISTKVYLVDFTPEKMRYLIEIIKRNNNIVSSKYFDTTFNIDVDNNDIKIDRIEEVDDILNYFEATFKNKSIENSEVDSKTAQFIIQKAINALDDEKYIELKQIYNRFINELNLEKTKYTSKDYMLNKQYIKNYLNNKKGI